jgi:hypothetical protein
MAYWAVVTAKDCTAGIGSPSRTAKPALDVHFQFLHFLRRQVINDPLDFVISGVFSQRPVRLSSLFGCRRIKSSHFSSPEISFLNRLP